MKPYSKFYKVLAKSSVFLSKEYYLLLIKMYMLQLFRKESGRFTQMEKNIGQERLKDTAALYAFSGQKEIKRPS